MEKYVLPKKAERKTYRVIFDFLNLKHNLIALGQSELMRIILSCNNEFSNIIFSINTNGNTPKRIIYKAKNKAQKIVLLYKFAFYAFDKKSDEANEFLKFFYENMSLISRYFPDLDSITILLKCLLCNEDVDFNFFDQISIQSMYSMIEKQTIKHQQQAMSCENPSRFEINELLAKLDLLNISSDNPRFVYNSDQEIIMVTCEHEKDKIIIPRYLKLKNTDIPIAYTSNKSIIQTLTTIIQNKYIRHLYEVQA